MVRENPDGSRTPLTMPNHTKIKGSTLRAICRQAGIERNIFLNPMRKHDYKAPILLELAKLRHFQHKESEALSLATEALTIANCCLYVLQ